MAVKRLIANFKVILCTLQHQSGFELIRTLSMRDSLLRWCTINFCKDVLESQVKLHLMLILKML